MIFCICRIFNINIPLSHEPIRPEIDCGWVDHEFQQLKVILKFSKI